MSNRILFDEQGNVVGRYLDGVSVTPAEAVAVTKAQWTASLNPEPGKVWKLIDGFFGPVDISSTVVDPTVIELCNQIDRAADAARSAVVVDPVRAIEYDRSREAAEKFKAAEYPTNDVPAMVAAWAIGGRTPREAADDILHQAAAYMGALEFLRTLRLKAKQEVKDLYAQPNVPGAVAKVAETIEIIRQAVEGVGNARVAG